MMAAGRLRASTWLGQVWPGLSCPPPLLGRRRVQGRAGASFYRPLEMRALVFGRSSRIFSYVFCSSFYLLFTFSEANCSLRGASEEKPSYDVA